MQAFPSLRHLNVSGVATFLLFFIFADAARAIPPAIDGPFPTASFEDFFTVQATGDPVSFRIYYPGTNQGIDLSGGPYPIAVVNHGFQLTRDTLFSYGEQLASHGIIAAVVERSRLQFDTDPLVQDLFAVVDFITGEGNNPASVLGGGVDASRLAFVGHSAGGKLSFYAAYLDPRVQCVVGLDPVDGGVGVDIAPALMPNITVPTLVIGTDLQGDICSPAAENFEQFYAAANAPKMKMTVLGGDHCGMLDNRPLLCICPAGSDTSQQYRISRDTTTAWVLRHLLGRVEFEDYFWDGPVVRADVNAGFVAVEFDKGVATPTPASTPTPTATPSPTMPVQRHIPLGGVLPGTPDAFVPNVTFIAWTGGVEAQGVGVYLGNSFSGIELSPSSPFDGSWSFNLGLPGGAQAKDIFLEYRSTNITGQALSWPYLVVGP